MKSGQVIKKRSIFNVSLVEVSLIIGEFTKLCANVCMKFIPL